MKTAKKLLELKEKVTLIEKKEYLKCNSIFGNGEGGIYYVLFYDEINDKDYLYYINVNTNDYHEMARQLI